MSTFLCVYQFIIFSQPVLVVFFSGFVNYHYMVYIDYNDNSFKSTAKRLNINADTVGVDDTELKFFWWLMVAICFFKSFRPP